MPRTNKTRFAILGFLSLGPMSAYEIKQAMAKSTAHFWQEHEAQLYPNLKTLHQEGLIDCEEQQAEKAGIRKVYSLTSEGEAALKAWLEKKAEKTVYRNEFLLKLFFGNCVPTAISVSHLSTMKTELLEELAIYEEIEKHINQLKPFPRKPFIYATLSYGIMLTKAEVEWCDKTLALLKESNA